ncbi:MAG: 3-hydroxyacyl-CoA dehydrogenase [Anaerolineae bacterium]|nr:3-hydroxyacyl-CoA dehydrogenase [Anaerolineae bacterium]
MELTDIKKILIVGGGTMGQQIGLQCAAHGYHVVIYDILANAIEKVLPRLNDYADQLIDAGHLDRSTAEAALGRITTTTNADEAAVDSDLISESVPEDPVLKGKVFAQFNALCPDRTVFTTNTSLLVPSLMAEATGRPDRFLALHFHQPVWVANVADVMPHPGTSAEVVALVRDFAKSIHQTPLVLNKENYGYVFNAMYSGLNRAAVTLAANEVASIEDIDRAWMGVMKMPIGPMGMLDVVGLDTAWHITEYWANQIEDTQIRKNADFLKTYVDQGWLGVKSGRGFYTYPHPTYQNPDFVQGE